MEDPLRPKSVPLAAETVLWFEFLLDPQLITKHLLKPNPDPSPIELMTQFISLAPDVPVVTHYEHITVPDENIAPGMQMAGTQQQQQSIVPTTQAVTVEGLKIPRKNLALKILALKVCTWLKWNLDSFEKNLNIRKQMALLRDLCTISFGKPVTMPLSLDMELKISPDGNQNAARFALTFYHRWVLRLQIIRSSDLSRTGARAANGNMYLVLETGQAAPEIAPQKSVAYLQELCKSTEPFYVFTYDTFIIVHAQAEDTKQNFANMKAISTSELRAQIYFDLVNFYLFSKQYHLAREAVCLCRDNYLACKEEYLQKSQTQADFLYAHLNDEELEGYLMACGVSAKEVTLMERFNRSQLTRYKDIVEILKLDNQQRVIPFVNRRILELDIEAAASQEILRDAPKRLEIQVGALNVVRSIFEEPNSCYTTDYFAKYRNAKCVPEFMDAVQSILPHLSVGDKNLLKNYLIENILKQSNSERGILLQQISQLDLFSAMELQELKLQVTEQELPNPALAALHEWKFQTKLQRIEIGSVERQLISCTNANTVRKLLVKLAATNPTKPLWTVNPSWEIATPIKSLLMSMPRGFLQDFAYVILGKARELTAKSDYVGAVSMLTVLKSETNRQELLNTSLVGKLSKLVNWEILLVQITQSLEEWNRKTLDPVSLNNRCKQCLNAMQNGDTIIPRIEIIESAALMLLNMNEWSALLHLDKRLPQLELYVSYANTFLDMEKMKGGKKICRDAWDLVLAMFQNTTTKRGSGAGSSSRSSPCLALSTSLQPFLRRIRAQTLFSLTISMLGKIHNILKDDPNYDLNGEYMQFWPTSISNPIGYSVRSVSETLHWLLTEALKYYPQTIVWLKMKGDLEMAIGNNEAAMRCYVNALVTGTDYCTIPLQRTVADDNVIRKMIRCCSNLGCHMQATILCQFLEEVDHGIVFKNLIEKSSNFADAMDAYYNCIWDTTMLEFIINLHARKGEHARKFEAIAIMGTLELNANNNDEIRREATAVRKTRFLRALAKQYLM